MIRDRIVQVQPTEPTIGQVEMDLFTQAPLRPDTHAIADQQHADHQFGIDRRATGGAVERRKVSADVRQVNEPVNLPQHMIVRHMPVQVELIKQRRLWFLLQTHHCIQSPKSPGKLNQPRTRQSSDFFNSIRTKRALATVERRTAYQDAIFVSHTHIFEETDHLQTVSRLLHQNDALGALHAILIRQPRRKFLSVFR